MMMTNKKSANYIDQSQIDILEKELKEIGHKYPYLASLGETELHRLKGGIAECVDLFSNRKVKIRAKVHIPVNQYPSINFVGKLLGPGATTLRGIQDQTNTKMTIIGAGVLKSRRDDFRKMAEMENKKGGENAFPTSQPKLHLQIDSLGTPAEAYYRLSHALIEVQNCMIHELPRGVIQPYHPVSAFNWNNYVFNTTAYDNYFGNGNYKNYNKPHIYHNRYKNVHNYKMKRLNHSNMNCETDNNMANGVATTKRFTHKNGPAGDGIHNSERSNDDAADYNI